MKKILEYKIFENISSGIGLKKMEGCATCTNSRQLLQTLGKKWLSSRKNNISSSGNSTIKSDEGWVPKIPEYNYLDEITLGAKNYYTTWFKKEATKKKFKNQGNIQKLIDFINDRIIVVTWQKQEVPEEYRKDVSQNNERGLRWVWTCSIAPHIPEWIDKDIRRNRGWIYPGINHELNLNMENIGNNLDALRFVLHHEMGHCIDNFLDSVGESFTGGNLGFSQPGTKKTDIEQHKKKIARNFGYNDWESFISDNPDYDLWRNFDNGARNIENYITDELENSTRLRTIRRVFEFEPDSSCEFIKQKLEKYLKNGELKFVGIESFEFVKQGDCWWLKLTPNKSYISLDPGIDWQIGPSLKDILILLDTEESSDDITRFFTHISQYKDGFLWIDLGKLTKMNQDLVINSDNRTETGKA